MIILLSKLFSTGTIDKGQPKNAEELKFENETILRILYVSNI